jgi:hypothetical protein
MPRDSQFWAGLMKVKDEFLSMGRFDLGDESQVRFWEDSWIMPHPFKTLFPSLYNIVRKKSVTVRTVLSTTPLNVAFRRSLMGSICQHGTMSWPWLQMHTTKEIALCGGCIRTSCFQLILCTEHY